MAKSAKRITTVQGVKNLKVTGKKYTRSIDVGVKGFGAKVTEAGGKFYTLTTRKPGATSTSQFTLGDLDELSFEDARTKAKEWLAKIEAGLDPRADGADVSVTALPTFGKAAEAWLDKRRHELRQFKAIANRAEHLQKAWEHKLLTEITRKDLIALYDGFSKSYARNLHDTLRAMYGNWRDWGVLPLNEWGEAYSPTKNFPVDSYFGKKPKRIHKFKPTEIVKLWEETGKMRFPFGAIFRVSLLSGNRKNEWVEASWEEIKGDVLIVPAERFKSGKDGREGRIQINSEVRKILDAVPHKSGYIFSLNGGLTAVTPRLLSEAKAKIMDHDPVADDADAAVLDWETGLPPIKHEDLPRIVQQKIAAELTRIRFELSALRKALEGGSHRE